MRYPVRMKRNTDDQCIRLPLLNAHCNSVKALLVGRMDGGLWAGSAGQPIACGNASALDAEIES